MAKLQFNRQVSTASKRTAASLLIADLFRIGSIAPKAAHLFLQNVEWSFARLGSRSDFVNCLNGFFDQVMERRQFAYWIGRVGVAGEQ